MTTETSHKELAPCSTDETCTSLHDTPHTDTTESSAQPKAEIDQSGFGSLTSPRNNGPANSLDKSNRSLMARFLDSFHRNPDHMHLNTSIEGHKEPPSARVGFDTSLLNRELKGRHIQMIAIGGAIGTGLFIGSGSALATGGPAALIIGFGSIGIMLFFVVHALGELAVMFPIAGSFSIYSTRFIDPAWGFAMGWNYALGWLVILPLELTASGITVNYWNTGINVGVFITIFLVLIIFINLWGVRGYGEAEVIFSMIKLIAVVGFIILSIVIDCGGAPKGGYLGAATWHNPGAFANGFKGVCSVFVTAAFAFSGTELIGLTAAECKDPRKTLPQATKQVFWRITIFYMISLFLVGLIVPYTNPQLLNGKSSVDIKASPFVIAIQNAGIKIVPSIFNAVILVSVLSVGNSSTYGSTRTICALAEIGQAPKIFAHIDKKGRPTAALALALLFSGLAYINIASVGPAVFNWLVALSGLSSFFTWGSICFAHIRFRKAWLAQGNEVDDLPFKAAAGVYGSWIGLLFNILCLIAQFYIALFPIGGTPSAATFFKAYLAAPVVLVFFLGWKISKKTHFVKATEANLISGRRLMNLHELHVEDIEKQSHWSPVKRVYYWLC